MVHAGDTCDTSHATASVPRMIVAPERSAVRSLSSTRRARIAAMPEPAASTSATVGVPPPRSDFEICTGAPKLGGFSHGAPVCCTWWRRVGSQGRYRSPTPPKPISASRQKLERTSDTYQHGISPSARPAPRNRPQLCV